jgi:single-stranded-DNA-specific exonuclease
MATTQTVEARVDEAVLPSGVAPRSSAGPAPEAVDLAGLAASLQVTRTVAAILADRHLTDPAAARRFLQPRLADLTAPDHMADRNVMAERLATAVRRRERVCVFGDYDCDGITATAILTGVLRRLGVEVVPLLASRFDGGYGVTAAAAERIAASGASLVVTCDCGSSDHAVLEQLVQRGQQVMVIDHHLVPDAPLPALAFINPHRPECGFPYKGLASCGLALSIAAALRAKLGAKLDLRDELDLVAIGTIADVAPLDGDNRALVRAGLERLRQAKRPGIRALNELAKLGPELPITAEDVAFRLAPRLNAPGRLGAPDLALETLLCGSIDRARGLAAELEQCQLERRRQQDAMVAQALEDIAANGYRERPGLVVGRPGWNHGIVGIVAGRLASELGRPVAAIGFDEHGVGRGSVRGPRGARLYDVLSSVADLLVRFGGHQAAAGLEVRLERLAELRERFEAACAAPPGGDAPEPETPTYEWFPADDPAQVVADLEQLEPCGEGNPAPQIVVEADLVAARQVRGGHLKLELEREGRRMGAFGVGLGDRAEALAGRVRVSGRLRRDRWRGGDAVEVGIDRVETAI